MGSESALNPGRLSGSRGFRPRGEFLPNVTHPAGREEPAPGLRSCPLLSVCVPWHGLTHPLKPTFSSLKLRQRHDHLMESLGEFRAQNRAHVFPTPSTLYLVYSTMPTPEPTRLGAGCCSGQPVAQPGGPASGLRPRGPSCQQFLFFLIL